MIMIIIKEVKNIPLRLSRRARTCDDNDPNEAPARNV